MKQWQLAFEWKSDRGLIFMNWNETKPQLLVTKLYQLISISNVEL